MFNIRSCYYIFTVSTSIDYTSSWVSIYLSIYPSINLSIYLYIHLSIYLFIHLSIYPSIYPMCIPQPYFLLDKPRICSNIIMILTSGDKIAETLNEGAEPSWYILYVLYWCFWEKYYKLKLSSLKCVYIHQRSTQHLFKIQIWGFLVYWSYIRIQGI